MFVLVVRFLSSRFEVRLSLMLIQCQAEVLTQPGSSYKIFCKSFIRFSSWNNVVASSKLHWTCVLIYSYLHFETFQLNPVCTFYYQRIYGLLSLECIVALQVDFYVCAIVTNVELYALFRIHHLIHCRQIHYSKRKWFDHAVWSHILSVM